VIRQLLIKFVLSAFCLAMAAGAVYIAYGIAWVALFASDPWVWLLFAPLALYAVFTATGSVASWRVRRAWIRQLHGWCSLGLFLVVTFAYFLGEVGFSEVLAISASGLSLFLCWLAMSGLHANAA